MRKYKYKCYNCKAEYSAIDIENNFIYLCPKCGRYKKNKPLKGVLEIDYDYDFLKSNVNVNSFLKNTVGKFWSYPYLWPLEFDDKGLKNITNTILDKLALNSNLISEIEIDNSVVKIFDDSRNLTLSYKDRASILVALKALQLGIKEISAASTGNAGSSLAGICARLGIKSHIFVPKNIPASKKLQIQSFGANLYIVDGDYDLAFDLCLEVSEKNNWYNRNTAYNPLTIEGKKSSIYDMFISLNGKLPEYIIVPVGDGVIISGIYKGIVELQKLGWIDKLPKLVAVQAEGSDVIINYLESGIFEYKTATTIADSICAGAPSNLYMAVDVIKNTEGFGIRVSDEEIISAQQSLSKKYGILAEPAAAATLAGYLKLREKEICNLDNSILMITGNGLKDIGSLEKWIETENNSDEIKSPSDWKKILN